MLRPTRFFVAGVAITMYCAAIPAAGADLEVAPGGIVRWPGEAVTRCSQGERSWLPLSDTCWFPVDLLKAPGPLRLQRTTAAGVESATVTVAAYPYPVQELTVASKMVHLSAADEARVAAENERIGALWQRTGAAEFVLPLGFPLTNPPAGTNFGNRRIFNNEPRSPHTGLDFRAPHGAPVLVVAGGEVVLAENHYFAGNSVFVDHGGGLISMYFHLDKIVVQPGAQVARGQTVGTIGATGRATGPHLHFGLRWHGARIDPRPLMGTVEGLPVVAAADSIDGGLKPTVH